MINREIELKNYKKQFEFQWKIIFHEGYCLANGSHLNFHTTKHEIPRAMLPHVAILK